MGLESKLKNIVGGALITVGTLGMLGNTFNVYNINRVYNTEENQLKLKKQHEMAIDKDFLQEKTSAYRTYKGRFGAVALSGIGMVLYRRKE